MCVENKTLTPKKSAVAFGNHTETTYLFQAIQFCTLNLGSNLYLVSFVSAVESKDKIVGNTSICFRATLN